MPENIALKRDRWIERNRYYYGRIKRLLRFIIEPQKRVLEVRCQTGGLLAAMEPSYGVGVEISQKLVDVAHKNHPDLNFICADPEDVALGEKFDYVIFGQIFDTVDILAALNRIRVHCTQDTRLLIINYNHLWEPVLELASSLGLRSPYIEPNWVSSEDVNRFLVLSGFAPLRTHQILLFPKYIPLISAFLNEFLAKLPGLRRLCMIQVTVAHPKPVAHDENEISVSVIVPCRNEEGNIQAAVERIPDMGKHRDHFLRRQIHRWDSRRSSADARLYPDRDIGCWMDRGSARLKTYGLVSAAPRETS